MTLYFNGEPGACIANHTPQVLMVINLENRQVNTSLNYARTNKLPIVVGVVVLLFLYVCQISKYCDQVLKKTLVAN